MNDPVPRAKYSESEERELMICIERMVSLASKHFSDRLTDSQTLRENS